MRIPALSLVFMALSALVATGLPVALFLLFRKKYGAKFVPALAGAAAFVIFALVLERLVHSFVLGRFNLRATPAAYIIYGTLMAGIFEESARFLSYLLLKKKYGGTGTALAYGTGHGGIESILLAGLTMAGNLAFCLAINSGNTEIFTKNLDGAALARINAQAAALAAAKPALFLAAGLERIFALGIQISLSVIVYHAVFSRNRRYLYPLAVALHAAIDVPAMLFQTGILKQTAVVEILAGAGAAALILTAKKIHESIKKEK